MWGMCDNDQNANIAARSRRSMLRLAAAILKRDFGPLSHQEALRRSDDYDLEYNDHASRFWLDVAAEIKYKNGSEFQS